MARRAARLAGRHQGVLARPVPAHRADVLGGRRGERAARRDPAVDADRHAVGRRGADPAPRGGEPRAAAAGRVVEGPGRQHGVLVARGRVAHLPAVPAARAAAAPSARCVAGAGPGGRRRDGLRGDHRAERQPGCCACTPACTACSCSGSSPRGTSPGPRSPAPAGTSAPCSPSPPSAWRWPPWPPCGTASTRSPRARPVVRPAGGAADPADGARRARHARRARACWPGVRWCGSAPARTASTSCTPW
nr:hypothetical protein [Angustibacter aerolatus]